jgi:hypothetical protein
MLAELKPYGVGVVRFSHALQGKFTYPTSTAVVSSLLNDLAGAVAADVDIVLTCEAKTDTTWGNVSGYGDWTGVNFTTPYCFRPPAGPNDITWKAIGTCWVAVLTEVINYLQGVGYDWQKRLVVQMPNEMREYDVTTNNTFSRPTFHRTNAAMAKGTSVIPCTYSASSINTYIAGPYYSTHCVIHTGNGTRQLKQIASVASGAITLTSPVDVDILSGAMFSFVKVDNYGAVRMFDEAQRDIAGYMAYYLRSSFPTLKIATGTMCDGFPCRDAYTGLGYDFIEDRIKAYQAYHLGGHPLGGCISEAHFNPYPRYDDSTYTSRWATLELYEDDYVKFLSRLVDRWQSYGPYSAQTCTVSEFGWTSARCTNNYGTLRPGGAGARDEFLRGQLTGRLARKIQDNSKMSRAIIYNSANGAILEYAFQNNGEPLESQVGVINGLQKVVDKTAAPPLDTVYGGSYVGTATTYRTITSSELP